MGAKKKNQSKTTGFYWYMQAIMPELRRSGRSFNNGLIDVVPVARPRWKRLTAAEKEPYERRAREEKKKNKGLRPDTERLDNLGDVIAHRENPEEVQKVKRESDRRKAKATWPMGQDLVHKKFYLLAFEVLCELEDPEARGKHDYIPREIGLVEWSMKNGVSKELHRFIDTDGIPMGFRFNAIEQHEKHKIPIEDFDQDDRDWRGMWEEIVNFVNPNRELEESPPIYCLSWQHRKIWSCMDWLHDHALSQGLEEANVLQDKLYILDDCVQDMFTHCGAITVSLTSVDDLLNTSAFDHEPCTRCKFHEDEGCVVCALGTVKRCVYSMADSLVEHYDFTLTHRHVPDPSMGRAEYTVINPTPTNVPAPPPSQNQQRNLGPFASRDIRYQDAQDDEDYDGDEIYVSDEEEALGDMLEAQLNVRNPVAWQKPVAQQQFMNPFAAPRPLVIDDDDDFPALGAAPMRSVPPPQSKPAWLQGPSVPEEKPMPSLQEAAAARRQEEQQTAWAGPMSQKPPSARGNMNPMQPPQTRPPMLGLRPAFKPPGSAGVGRGVMKLSGVGRGGGAPVFIPPPGAASMEPSPGEPSRFAPKANSPSRLETSSPVVTKPRAPTFIPPSGDAPVYEPAQPRPPQPPQAAPGRGRGMAFPPPPQQASAQPQLQPQPQPQLQPQPMAQPPQPTTRPLGLVGRGRGAPLRPPPGFGRSTSFR